MTQRKKKKSGLEQWSELFAKLPWLLCVALAVPAHFLFATLETWPVPAISDTSQMGSVVIAQSIRTGGMIGQYVAPGLLLIAALKSFLAKRRRTRLLQTSRSVTGSAEVMKMSWQDFERLIHAWFEDRSYKVASTPAGPDGGVDLVLKRDGETFLVQCKRWRANRIGVSIVRELYGVMVAQGATGGFVVGVGEFTNAARGFAIGRNIDLIDARIVITERASTTGVQTRTPVACESQPPNCPRCKAVMLKRIARKGTSAGQAFYGCSRFPECRATKALNSGQG